MHAWHHSFPEVFVEREDLGDLGYVGCGLNTSKPPGHERSIGDKAGNRSVNTLRAAVERATTHSKDGKIFATRYRGPLTRFPDIVKAVTALALHKAGR